MNIQIFLAKNAPKSYTFKNRIFWTFHVSGFWGNPKGRTLIFFVHLWFLSISPIHKSDHCATEIFMVKWLGDVLVKNRESSSSHQKPGFRVPSLHSSSLLKGGLFTWLQIPPNFSIWHPVYRAAMHHSSPKHLSCSIPE